MKKLYVIYCHINKINGKRYIGQTNRNLQKRFGHDGKSYIHSTLFYNAIKKYGWDNFEHIILEKDLTQEEANEREQYWITYYHTWIEDPQCWGYNLESGGSKNKQLSQNTKDNIRKRMINNQYGKNNRGKTYNTKKIKCIETDIIYNNVKEAAKSINRTIGSLYRALNNSNVKCNKCHWIYINE